MPGRPADKESDLEGRTDSAAESVTLITIHSAKGLEACHPHQHHVQPTAPRGPARPAHQLVAAKLFGQACSVYEATKQQEDLSWLQNACGSGTWPPRGAELLVVPRHEAKVAAPPGATCWSGRLRHR